MRDKFKIKQNDTIPQLLWLIKPSSLDLTGATVVFNMRAAGGGSIKVNRAAATVEDTSPPKLGYQFTAADTNTAGDFEGEFEVTFADGNIGTFPGEDYIPIVVGDDIA